MPSANHITRLLDKVTPEDFTGVFNEGPGIAAQMGALDRYRVLGKHHLIALDGVWFYQSTKVRCTHCLTHKMSDGETLYYHDMVAAVLVKGKEETVLPLRSLSGTKTGRRNRIASGMRQNGGLRAMRSGINGLIR